MECGVLLSTDTYLEEFNFGLMQVVFEWAKGAMVSRPLTKTHIIIVNNVRFCVSNPQDINVNNNSDTNVTADFTKVYMYKSIVKDK